MKYLTVLLLALTYFFSTTGFAKEVMQLSPTSNGVDSITKFDVNFELAELGIDILSSASAENSVETRKQLLDHPLMKVAFERYSSPMRPPQSRVDNDLYSDFLVKILSGKFDEITHPRLKFILPDYQWGIKNIDILKADLASLRKDIPSLLDEANKVIPWNHAGVSLPTRPIHVVFLLDPGGSYPWATSTDSKQYLYLDLLKIRGFTDQDRQIPYEPELIESFLAHEIFHLVQKDQNPGVSAAQWFIKMTVAEGSASLFGNNAEDSFGRRLDLSKPIKYGNQIANEWNFRIKNNRVRIQEWLKVINAWEQNPPTDEQKFAELVSNKWISSPANGLLIGDMYRVGVEMLLDIREKLGDAAFYEAIENSELFISYWNRAMPVNQTESEK
jgi:hypothetical protein